MWAIGLGFCAAAGHCAAKSQRKFQVAAGNNFRRLAKEFFDLQVSYQPIVVSDDAKSGFELRERFWGLWGVSIVFFVVGAFLAICHLG